MNITPHVFLTPPIEFYSATNVRKKFLSPQHFGKFSN